jgi:hypothetical protein
MLTGQQLGSYLAWAIHGRKPQRRAASSTRKGAPRDPVYLAWVREMPCLACGTGGRSEAAHTGSDGGMSMKASDYSVVPLCADCHRYSPDSYHRAGKGAFERRHGLCLVRVVAQLNREWQSRCA